MQRLMLESIYVCMKRFLIILTYTLHCGTRSTLSGKYFCLTSGLGGISCMGTGRPGFGAWYFVPDLCLGRCRNCIVQACRPNGPRINIVIVGCGS